MPKVTQTGSRKTDHIRINLEEDVRSGLTTGLERFRFTHQALPELDLEAIDLSTKIFGRKLQAPILISSMTGGTKEAKEINLNLAEAAQEMGVAMGLGSQRAAIEHPETASTFQVRQVAPDILLFANLGAIQLNYGYGVDECQRAVDMVEADALYLHLNALQEAVQPEGDTNFAGLLHKIEAVCRALECTCDRQRSWLGHFGRHCPPIGGCRNRCNRCRWSRGHFLDPGGDAPGRKSQPGASGSRFSGLGYPHL